MGKHLIRRVKIQQALVVFEVWLKSEVGDQIDDYSAFSLLLDPIWVIDDDGYFQGLRHPNATCLDPNASLDIEADWDQDGDGVYNACEPEACEFPNGECQNLTPARCYYEGGEPQGPGSECVACCLANFTCQDLLAADCLAQGGTPQDTDCASLPDDNNNGIPDACGADLDDYQAFCECFFGPEATPNPTNPPPTTADCLSAFDFDVDGDVDVGDFIELQLRFDG